MTRLVSKPCYIQDLYIGHAITTTGAFDALRRFLDVQTRDVDLIPYLSEDRTGFFFKSEALHLSARRSA